jgi:pimeloyl-ACP methyl ester carboxylesterase
MILNTHEMKRSVAKRLLAAGSLLALAVGAVSAEDAAGDWGGLLAGQYRIAVHVTKDGAGHYKAALESPDQGSVVLPVADVVTDADHLNFTIPKISATYTGRWDAGKKGWVGTWTQGAIMPLFLTRMTGQTSEAAPPKRPQEEAIAAGPRPYRQQEVAFDNASAGIRLAGTLSVPDGTGPFPAVVLIGGTGPGTRDENSFGHQLFVVLADALNRRGIAVLRYDKRGVGGSGGDFATATIPDLASDAEAAMTFLMSRPEIEAKHIGLIGHSEGGAIAPMIAVRNPAARFAVLMAGPGMRIGRLLNIQDARIARASGVPEEQIAKRSAFFNKLYADLATTTSNPVALSVAKADIARGVTDKLIRPENAEVLAHQVTSPWARQAFNYDPIPTLRALRTPVLVLDGGRDLYVPPEDNLPAIKAALKGNPGATIVELPDINHMFQTAKIGTPAESASIEETMSPVALKMIVDWVVAHGS